MCVKSAEKWPRKPIKKRLNKLMNGLEEFRQFLVSLLTEARELSSKATSNSVRAALDGQVRLLERLTVFISNSIKEGTLDMDKAKADIKVIDQGIMEDIGRSAREKSPVTIKLVEVANSLRPNGYSEFDPKHIDRLAFEQKIYNLRGLTKQGKPGGIPEDIFPKKRIKVNGEWKEGLFLVKLSKQQMSAEPKRRKRQEA